MRDKIKYICITMIMTVSIFGTSLFCLAKKAEAISVSERRKLAQMPVLTWEALVNGSFMTDFEKYTLDQFPMRDDVRRIKAMAQFYLLCQKDNNDIYLVEGSAAALAYPLNEKSVLAAATKFRQLYETYLADKNMNIYYAIAPDKNYYMAGANGYPHLDYEKMVSLMGECNDFMEYIDLFDCLEASDYYATDSHWRQEHLKPVVDRIAQAMGILELLPEFSDYEVKGQKDFYGVYYGQSALPLPSESIYYLTNPMLEQCVVTNFETGKKGEIYDADKAQSDDRYEIFLSGASALLTIENPNATSDRELFVFRDSFGSSFIPLLAGAYAKITVIDIRYVASEYLAQLVRFTEGQDVLFLYNTLVLNSSGILK